MNFLRILFSRTGFAAILLLGWMAAVQMPAQAQTRPPIELTRLPAGAKFFTTGVSGYLYYAESSVDGGLTWRFLSSMKLGKGKAVEWSFGTPEPGTPRQFYRIRVSATGGYTDTTAAALDSDADGIQDWKELDNYGTSPFNPDTDQDGIPDFLEISSGLNPKVADDGRPGVFTVSWQRGSMAYLSPEGWESNKTAAIKPNCYRKLKSEATENLTAKDSSQEWHHGKTMTIQRVLQADPAGYMGDGSEDVKNPYYNEQVTYSHTTGQPFVSIAAHKDPSTWLTPAPGAIALRAKQSGVKVSYDYGWDYAAPVSNQVLLGEFGTVDPPREVSGEDHVWVDPPVAIGGNRYAKSSTVIALPNRNYPPYGGIMTGTWNSDSSCTSTESSEGITTLWTLENRWTYADVRSELDRLWDNVRATAEWQDDFIPEGSAWRTQTADGFTDVGIFEFQFRKTGGGVGATTLMWTETFTPEDNPDTTAVDESTAAAVVKLRRLPLPPNSPYSQKLKLDPRVSCFTLLPGETAPTGTVPFGGTIIGSLLNIQIEADPSSAGLVGDVVKSAKPASPVRHFVTPKKSTDLPDDYVTLTASGLTLAQITPGDPGQIAEWSGGEAIPGDPIRRRVKRDATGTGPTEVKIKAKDNGEVIAQMNVWVVWVDFTAKTSGTSLIDGSPLGNNSGRLGESIYQATVGIDFVGTIRPQAIILNTERPAMERQIREFAPGGLKLYDGIAGGKNLDASGSDFSGWDVSRQVTTRAYKGPGLTATSASDGEQFTWNDYPLNYRIGNDDKSVKPDEDSNPYAPGKGKVGELISTDAPKLRRHDNYDAVSKTPVSDGDRLRYQLWFREFARAQIGPAWYKVSDFQPWRFHFFLKRLNGAWQAEQPEIFDTSNDGLPPRQ